jgi:uncharacterized protein
MTPSIQAGLLTSSPHTLLPGKVNSIVKLKNTNAQDVLSFLDERPNVILSGLIHDNGLESKLNRGEYYGYRGAAGTLEGVALIGHATLFETSSDDAMVAFARLASETAGVKLILGERDKIEKFWERHSETANVAHHRRNELMFEQRWAAAPAGVMPGLRRATLADLNHVVAAHACMAEEELGVNPLTTDADGFQMRCERRVRQGRVWVLINDRRLIFKADVVAATAAANYLEGVYVNPQERNKGYGVRCLTQITRELLADTQAVCLLVSEHNRVGQGLARKAGYAVVSCYETIFLNRKRDSGEKSIS